MNWFGRKSAGRALPRPVQSSFPLGVSGVRLPVLGDWPRSYEAQVREGYLDNAIAQRAVRLVAEGVATTPITTTDDAALALVTATSAGQSLLETVTVHVLLHGNAYVEILSGADRRPCELYALRPERMAIEADARGWPVAFMYRVGTNSSRMAAESIIHIRSIHPLDDHYGLGCLGAASGAVAVHNAAATWNKALLDNAARPSGALMAEAGEALSPEQFERLKAELKDGFQGAINAGRPMLLEGGLKWQSLSLSPADMDFIALKSAAAREIALAFGVPPMLLGLPGDATYANYREANKALWRQAILPLADKILAAIAEGLRPHFPGLTMRVDLDKVTALSEDRERLWAQVGAAEFLTLNEKREIVGFEAVELGKPDRDSSDSEPESDAPTEVKVNIWHDRDNGQFTHVGQGVQSGEGGGAGGVAAMSRRPKKDILPAGAVRTTGGRIIQNKPTISYQEPGLNGKGYKPKRGDANQLARIIYAESLSNPEDFEAIGWATVNRVGERQHGMTLDAVLRKRNGFEILEVGGGPKGDSPLWNETADPSKLKGDKKKGWDRAVSVSNGIFGGTIPDPTGGATFFMSSSTYVRGVVDPTANDFFSTRIRTGQLVESRFRSSSKRKRQNYFFVEKPLTPPRPKASETKR